MITVLQLAVTAARVMPGWSAGLGTYHHEGAYLDGPGGARLQVKEIPAGTAVVAGHFPASRASTGLHVIRVRMDRGGGVLAAEIKRRLLPGYLPDLARAHAAVLAEQADTAARHAVRDQLLAVLGPAGSLIGHCQSDGRSEVRVRLPDYKGGDLRLSRDGTDVEFTRFRVPADLAVAMVALLAGDPDPNDHL